MFDFLSEKFFSVLNKFVKNKKITEENIKESIVLISESLLQADVPYDVVTAFVDSVKKDAVGKSITSSLNPSEQLVKLFYDKIVAFLGGVSGTDTVFTFSIPSIMMLIGLQGSGKTTTASKLAYYLKEQAQKKGKKRKILLASVDFYRPAAIDQLEILSKDKFLQDSVFFYRATSQDVVLACKEIMAYYQSGSFDHLILDTAGRMHVDEKMLDELKNIDNIIKPKYKILVLDSMIGQESLNVAQRFESSVGFAGAILTKMDSDSKAGVAFAFKYSIKKPILFVATGEKIADFELFRPERVASRIVGMGDLMSLVEKAEEKISVDFKSAFEKDNITLHDFAKQMEALSSMGSLKNLIGYIPGLSGMVNQDAIRKGEEEMKRFKSIINSMTPKERLKPAILDKSRKERISKGAGVKFQDVDNLLSRFNAAKQLISKFKKMGKF